MQKANLMLHCGGYEVSKAVLMASPTPEATKTHVPIPHFDFQEKVCDFLKSSSFEVVHEAHALAKTGAIYFGLLQIANKAASDDYTLTIGLRNAHDKSLASGICVGSTVFVCDNLSFSGELVMRRKHTVNINRDLDELIGDMIERVDTQRKIQDDRFIEYKQKEIKLETGEHALCELYRSNVISSHELGRAVIEWKEPTHEEFAEDMNVWRLFNAVTEVSRGKFQSVVKRSSDLHTVCDSMVGYELPKAA